MAIFNSPNPTPKRETPFPPQPESALKKEPDPNEIGFATTPAAAAPAPTPTTAPAPAARTAERDGKESLIAADLSIEGKIQGSGHIRIAGRFKGDVQVDGDLTVEVGAKLNGGVRARKVVVAGELEGNIESAERVELLQGGVIVGDVKAGTVIIAAGSKMRGQVEFGWDEKDTRKPSKSEGKAESAASA